MVLVGATGDTARRKLLPGTAHTALSSLAPEIWIVGTSTEDFDHDGFRGFARSALEDFGRPLSDEQWERFAQRLSYVPQSAGPQALAAAVERAEEQLGPEARRLHYLSVRPGPPSR